MRFDLTVFQRLLISFGILTFLAIASVVAGMWFISYVEESHTALLQSNSLSESVNQLIGTWQQIVSTADEILITQEIAPLEDDLNQLVNSFDEDFNNLYSQPLGLTPETNAANRAILEDLGGFIEELVSFNQEFVEMARTDQWGIAEFLRGTRLALLQYRLEGQMDILNQNIQEETIGAIDEAARVQDITRVYWVIISIAVVGFALATSWIASRSIVGPINQLTRNVARITGGDFSPIEPLPQKDEIGDLSRAFALLTDWLRDSYETLEKRVAERTDKLEARSIQVQVAAEIARDIASFHDLDELLNHAVDIIRERFGFYHAGIFMLDDRQEFAILKAATGGAGALMVDQGHRLKVGETGLVGHVARTSKSRIALDVGKDSVHFKNPLLPGTRSEAALPIRVADRMIGVLDVQSREESAFDEDSLTILGIIADQLAVAIENARLVDEFQHNLLEMEELHKGFSQQIWERYIREAPTQGYQYDGISVTPLRVQKKPIEDLGELYTPLDQDNWIEDGRSGKKSPISFPLKIRGQVIGSLDVWPQSDQLAVNEENLLRALSDRLGQFLENSRLFENTQKTARLEKLTSDVATQMRASLDLETVLRTAVDEIYDALDLDDLVIQLTPELTDN